MAILPTFQTAEPTEPELYAAVQTMLGQVPIVMAIRAGGVLRIPAAEIDGTGAYMLDMTCEAGDFVFTATKKQ